MVVVAPTFAPPGQPPSVLFHNFPHTMDITSLEPVEPVPAHMVCICLWIVGLKHPEYVQKRNKRNPPSSHL